MKKQYTKKQITEAIAYWERQLKRLDESTLGWQLGWQRLVSNDPLPKNKVDMYPDMRSVS